MPKKEETRAEKLAREAKAEAKREREEEQRATQDRLLTTDDGADVEGGQQVSTAFTYVNLPVGKSITGVYVELKSFRNRFDADHPQQRPVLLVKGETVILPGHSQLVAAFQKIRVGATVKVACTERVAVGMEQEAYRYRVSAAQAGGDLPF